MTRQRKAMLGGVRKAFASRGDDATLTRFVKVTEEPDTYKQGRLKGTRFVASGSEKRTLFPKSRKPAGPRMLVSGHNNVKIGRDVRKGKLYRGYWIYTLSFEERATCPEHCHHWDTCYGNNMPFAKRVDHADPELFDYIEENVEALLSIRGRKGILVRLHALGDFFSVDYVRLWWRLLAKHENLACFGYTAHKPQSRVGRKIAKTKRFWGRRFAIRWSTPTVRADTAVPFVSRVPNGVIACPEQTGATRCCATCALCWETDKPIGFAEH